MSSTGKLGTTFLNLTGSRSSGNTISLRFNAEDSKTYEIDIHAGCAALLTTALMTELSKVSPDQIQPIRITSVQAGGVGDAPLLALTMEGGGMLPLRLEYGDLGELIELLQSMTVRKDGTTH